MAKKIKQRKKYSKRYFLIAFSLVVGGITIFAIGNIFQQLINSSFFKIRNIEISRNGNGGLKKEIVKMVENKSILTLNLQRTRSQLLSSHLEIKELRIIKIFPDSLKIEVIKRIPLCQVKSDKYYIVDKDLLVIEESEHQKEDLIVVEIGKMRRKIKKGDFIDDKRVIKVSELIDILDKFPAFTPSIILARSLDSFSMVVDGTKVILGDSDFERKLKILDSLVKNKFNRNLSLLRYVDLRYSKVYIGRKR